jgi:hypothetical protein
MFQIVVELPNYVFHLTIDYYKDGCFQYYCYSKTL